jgi:hypothetical protein
MMVTTVEPNPTPTLAPETGKGAATMADEQDRPGDPPRDQPLGEGADPAPPQPAKKAPAKAAKKAPAPAKSPAKKAPAKKAATAKKAPAKKAAPPPVAAAPPNLVATNGERPQSTPAQEAAAQAKSAIATAPSPIPLPGPDPSRLPLVAAVVAGLLAVLAVLLVRRGTDDD